MYQGKFDKKYKQTTPVVFYGSIPQGSMKKTQPRAQENGPRLGGLIFYTIFFLCVLLFYTATYFGLSWLRGWLINYEMAQPTRKCEEVFTQLFADPDWGVLYDSAGIQDTVYESKGAFVSYMKNKVGG